MQRNHLITIPDFAFKNKVFEPVFLAYPMKNHAGKKFYEKGGSFDQEIQKTGRALFAMKTFLVASLVSMVSTPNSKFGRAGSNPARRENPGVQFF